MSRTSDVRLDRSLIMTAVILLTGAMAVVFDTTIVNVALDTLARQLSVSVATIQWVTTGYLLALGIVVPISGWAFARFGGKRMWMLALAIFLAGSIASSLAWNAPSLIAFRVLQGVGGGLMLPLMQTILVRKAGGQSLGRLMAVVGLPIVIGPILGPVLGGVLVDSFGWRSIFWLNIPFCVAGLIAAWRGLPADAPARDAQSPRLDWIGLVLLSPGLAAIVYGLSRVGVTGGFGDASVIVPLVLGAALVAAFAVWSLRARIATLVDVRLFRSRTFTASSVLLFGSGLVLYGAMLLLPLYYQQVRGASALAAGLMLAPQGVGSLLARFLAGKLSDRFGGRLVVVGGLLLTVLGTIPFTQVGTHPNDMLLIAALVVRGAGLSAVTIPVMATAYEGLPREAIPHASSLTRILQQIGGAFGSAMLAVVLETQLAAHAGGGMAARASAFDVAFWWSLGFTVLAIVPALFLPHHRVAGRSPSPAGDSEHGPQDIAATPDRVHNS